MVKSNAFCQVGVVDDGIGSAGCAGDLGGVSVLIRGCFNKFSVGLKRVEVGLAIPLS